MIHWAYVVNFVFWFLICMVTLVRCRSEGGGSYGIDFLPLFGVFLTVIWTLLGVITGFIIHSIIS